MLSGFFFYRGRFIAIGDLQSTICNSDGGIAQLVERQLCKLDVRGSNPLASKSFEGRRFAIAV